MNGRFGINLRRFNVKMMLNLCSVMQNTNIFSAFDKVSQCEGFSERESHS